jgi:hypothetical protein
MIRESLGKTSGYFVVYLMYVITSVGIIPIWGRGATGFKWNRFIPNLHAHFVNILREYGSLEVGDFSAL